MELIQGCSIANDGKTIVYNNEGRQLSVGYLEVNGRPTYDPKFIEWIKKMIAQNSAYRSPVMNNGFNNQMAGQMNMSSTFNNGFNNPTPTVNSFTGLPSSSNNGFSNPLLAGGVKETPKEKTIERTDYFSSVTSINPTPIMEDMMVKCNGVRELTEHLKSSNIDFLAIVKEFKSIVLTSSLTADKIKSLLTTDGISMQICPNLDEQVTKLYNDKVPFVKMTSYITQKSDLKSITQSSFGSDDKAINDFENFKSKLEDFMLELKSVLVEKEANEIIDFPIVKKVLGACSENMVKELNSIDTIRWVEIPANSYFNKLEVNVTEIYTIEKVFRVNANKIQIKEVL